jgi:pyruvate/2-oxoglutarate dehydrogenase complex dihydrolipoamide acyltransferase (E2) component
MSVDVLLPKLGFSMNEGQVAEWLAPDGGEVSAGQPLFVLESEKSSNEIEAPASGVLRILKPTNETFEVGTVLATIE